MVQPLWTTVWQSLKKLKIELLYDPAIPLLDTYPEKAIIRKDTCPQMLIAVFTIADVTEATQVSSSRGTDKEDVVQ